MSARVQIIQAGGGKPSHYHTVTITATPEEVLKALLERFGGQMRPDVRKRAADRTGAKQAAQKKSFKLSLPWTPHAAEEVDLDL